MTILHSAPENKPLCRGTGGGGVGAVLARPSGQRLWRDCRSKWWLKHISLAEEMERQRPECSFWKRFLLHPVVSRQQWLGELLRRQCGQLLESLVTTCHCSVEWHACLQWEGVVGCNLCYSNSIIHAWSGFCIEIGLWKVATSFWVKLACVPYSLQSPFCFGLVSFWQVLGKKNSNHETSLLQTSFTICL